MVCVPIGILPHPRDARHALIRARCVYSRHPCRSPSGPAPLFAPAFLPAQSSHRKRYLAALGLSLGSRIQRSPSNPALRILLRAVSFTRDALQRITSATSLRSVVAGLAHPALASCCGRSALQAHARCARAVAKLGRPGLAKQPGPTHPASGCRLHSRCASTHRENVQPPPIALTISTRSPSCSRRCSCWLRGTISRLISTATGRCA